MINNEENKKEENGTETEWKYVKHTTKGKLYMLVSYIFMYLAFVFFSAYILNKIFPEEQYFQDILSIIEPSENNINIDKDSEAYKELLKSFMEPENQNKNETNN